jgi:hypothetical protein
MSIAAGFLSVKKPKYVDLGEERQTTEGDADAEPAHNITKYFVPNL